MKVLIIDDNKIAADALGEVLRLMGHQAVVAYSGSAALVRMEELGAELLFVDLALPDMDGYELVRRLRRIATPAARFVALTGYGPGIGGNLAGNLFDEHVTKPMSPEVMLRVLGAARDQQEGQQEGDGSR